MSETTRVPTETKIQLMEAIKAGGSTVELAKFHGIPYATVSAWYRNYRKFGYPTAQEARIAHREARKAKKVIVKTNATVSEVSNAATANGTTGRDVTPSYVKQDVERAYAEAQAFRQTGVEAQQTTIKSLTTEIGILQEENNALRAENTKLRETAKALSSLI